jgi:hypothetical protein
MIKKTLLIIQKVICFFFGHKYFGVQFKPNEYGGTGIISSYHGWKKCQRCCHEDDWQYDI